MSNENEVTEEAPAKAVQTKAKSRSGWDFEIPGELLDPDHTRWTPEQREKGIKVGARFLKPSDERLAINRAVSDGGGAGSLYIQVELSLASIDGQAIPYSDRSDVWDAIGPMGRAVAIETYTMANSPSQEAQRKVRESFRLRA